MKLPFLKAALPFSCHKFIGMTSQGALECGFRFQLAGSFNFRNLGLVTGPVGAFGRVKTGIGCPFSAAMRIASTSPVKWDVSHVRNGRLASINDCDVIHLHQLAPRTLLENARVDHQVNMASSAKPYLAGSV